MRKLFFGLTLVLLAGLFQNTGLFTVFGIKPDLLLSALIAFSFFAGSFPEFLALAAASVPLLRFEPGFRPELAAWVFLLAVSYFVGRIMPWRRSVNNLALIASVTIIFYLLADIGYLTVAPLAVLGEIFYTSVFGVLFYDLFRQLGDNEDNIFKR